MKKTFLFIYMMLHSIVIFSQKTGDDYRKEGELQKAVEAYTMEFFKNPKNSENTYKLASTYALSFSYKDSVYRYLDIALKEDNRLWVLADNDFIALKDDDRWKTIEEQQLKKYQANERQLQNPEYAKKLLRLIMKDQSMDYQIDQARKHYMKKGSLPHWYYPIEHLKRQFTNGNFENMENLIKKYGWPTYSSVGELAADAPLLIINHHEKDEIRIKYLEKIKQACFNKEGSCMEYAKIQDRILVNQGKEQIYGMQFMYDKNRKLIPFPIQNPEYVDERRLKIGLEPIKKYLKRKINYDWTIEQKKK